MGVRAHLRDRLPPEESDDLGYAVRMVNVETPQLDTVESSDSVSVARAKAELASHRCARSLRSPAALRNFMEHHVMCVLDFMSIVKSLQRDLTSVGPVWTPPLDREGARFINEIVLDEESDAEFGEHALSHYEWYLAAMEQVGADTLPIRGVTERLRQGEAPLEVLSDCALPGAAVRFGRKTFELLEGPLHVRASIFFHGREDVIPQLFIPIVDELTAGGTDCSLFKRYLERHIEADGEHHGPLARRILGRILAGDPRKEREAREAAETALEARRALWDALAAMA